MASGILALKVSAVACFGLSFSSDSAAGAFLPASPYATSTRPEPSLGHECHALHCRAIDGCPEAEMNRNMVRNTGEGHAKIAADAMHAVVRRSGCFLQPGALSH